MDTRYVYVVTVDEEERGSLECFANPADAGERYRQLQQELGTGKVRLTPRPLIGREPQAENTHLTKRQHEVKQFLAQHEAAFGYAPTLAEICRRFGYSSPATAHEMLEALERKGHIKRAPQVARGITVL